MESQISRPVIANVKFPVCQQYGGRCMHPPFSSISHSLCCTTILPKSNFMFHRRPCSFALSEAPRLSKPPHISLSNFGGGLFAGVNCRSHHPYPISRHWLSFCCWVRNTADCFPNVHTILGLSTIPHRFLARFSRVRHVGSFLTRLRNRLATSKRNALRHVTSQVKLHRSSLQDTHLLSHTFLV